MSLMSTKQLDIYSLIMIITTDMLTSLSVQSIRNGYYYYQLEFLWIFFASQNQLPPSETEIKLCKVMKI